VTGIAKLPEPTICDMTCFKQRGHDGPHQKWAGDPCDNCGHPALWLLEGMALCDDCRLAERARAGLERAANEGRNVLPDATDDQAHVIETWALRVLGRI
jgi:hypothetical protein